MVGLALPGEEATVGTLVARVGLTEIKVGLSVVGGRVGRRFSVGSLVGRMLVGSRVGLSVLTVGSRVGLSVLTVGSRVGLSVLSVGSRVGLTVKVGSRVGLRE